MAKEKTQKETKVKKIIKKPKIQKEKKKILEKKIKVPEQIIKAKKIKVPKRQKALEEKKAKLAVKARQTKWAPFWVVLRKYGTGGAKFHHVSQMTKHRRSWRRTKLHIKPRRQKKSHFG